MVNIGEDSVGWFSFIPVKKIRSGSLLKVDTSVIPKDMLRRKIW